MVEAIVLMRTDELMRVALRGYRDAVEFVAGEDGTWLSESGEPVRIGSRLPQIVKMEAIDDFICSQDVMDQLLGAA